MRICPSLPGTQVDQTSERVVSPLLAQSVLLADSRQAICSTRLKLDLRPGLIEAGTKVEVPRVRLDNVVGTNRPEVAWLVNKLVRMTRLPMGDRRGGLASLTFYSLMHHDAKRLVLKINHYSSCSRRAHDPAPDYKGKSAMPLEYDDGVSFSISQDQQSFRLLELPPAVFEFVASNNPPM